MRVKPKHIASVWILSLILWGFFLPPVLGQENESTNSSLKGGLVTPESGSWNSVFTFRATYYNSRNNPPPVGYPKVSVDGVTLPMREENTADENFVDGKTYLKEWIPGTENIGNHSFYFYISDNDKELVRDPDNGEIEGPLVAKIPTTLNFGLEEKKDVLSFSGSLTVADENSEVSREDIVIYKVEENENIFIKEVQTGKNGEFSFSIDPPESKGIYRYDAKFEGTFEYAQSKSDGVYFHDLDVVYVASILVLFFLAIVFCLVILLTRGFDLDDYLVPVILGGLGTLLLLLFLGVPGLFLGGLLVGYLFSKNRSGWTKQLRVGVVGGAVVFTAYSLPTLLNGLVSPESLSLSYSISQSLLLKNFLLNSLTSEIVFSVTVGLGAIVGGYLRKAR